MDTYESVLLVKNEVFVFKIPPMTTNRGYKAADWNLNDPQWTGRMRLVSKGKECIIKLEDKTSGELFAACPIDKYPGVAIEAVSDSSRYFVLKIQDDNGRTAFIGVGFSDRSDSFDLNVALQDHFNWLKKTEEIEKEKNVPKPELDLRFKEGETIKINMKITKKDGSETSSKQPKTSSAKPQAGGLLPPPPGGVKIAPPPAPPSINSSPSHHTAPSAVSGGSASSGAESGWGEFASASSGAASATVASATTPNNPNWVQF